MLKNGKTLLCNYRYDPLDRLASCMPGEDDSAERFYMKDRLCTEIQGAVRRSVMQHEEQLLAQQQQECDNVETRLLATDQQRSVLNVVDVSDSHPLAYTPYGYRTLENGLLSLLCFSGERPDWVTGHYLLGKGYRAFNPVLMRFNSPDSLSPFGNGGLNCYAYCQGDPVNYDDPTGNMRRLVLPLRSRSISPSAEEVLHNYNTRALRRPKPSNPIQRAKEAERKLRAESRASRPAGTAGRPPRANVDADLSWDSAPGASRSNVQHNGRNGGGVDDEIAGASAPRESLFYSPNVSEIPAANIKPRQQKDEMGVLSPRYTEVVSSPPSFESAALQRYRDAANRGGISKAPSEINSQVRNS